MSVPRPPRRLLVFWLALLFLLGGNVLLAFVAVGVPVHIAIAAMMAAIVLIVFMELDRGVSLFWVFAGAGFFWLALLFVLTAADYLTRYSFAPS